MKDIIYEKRYDIQPYMYIYICIYIISFFEQTVSVLFNSIQRPRLHNGECMN